MKSSNDTVGNRTGDLPDCSAVPQPTASPRTSFKILRYLKMIKVELQIGVQLASHDLVGGAGELENRHAMSAGKGAGRQLK